MSHQTRGTREWAYRNLNICKGCPHNCTYCYARRIAKRFKRVENREDWVHWKLNHDKIEKGYRKLHNPHPELYDYMFPTSHDIFPEILDETLIVLRKILEVGNSVLITTKPHKECIYAICDEFAELRDQITFRFTITTNNNHLIERYEPNAPRYDERYEAMQFAYEHDFTTSVSIEPFLDETPFYLIDEISGIVNDEIWIGIMSGSIPEELKPHYTKDNLRWIYKQIKYYPAIKNSQIRWKDSIVNKLQLSDNRIHNPRGLEQWI